MTLEELIRRDLDKPVEEWSEADKQAWRDMGWRVPRSKTKKDEK